MIKKAILGVIVAVAILAVSYLLWATRRDAIPGVYHAEGVWGKSTLTLRPDHSFTQDVQFMDYDDPSTPPYPQHPTLHKVNSGQWVGLGRSYFEQKIEVKPFVSLMKNDKGKTYDVFPLSFGPVGFALGIEVDPGANITYWK
jgi:hypothetical protein